MKMRNSPIPIPNRNPNSEGECSLDHCPKNPELREQFIALQSQAMHHINNPFAISDLGEFLDDESLQELAQKLSEIRIKDTSHGRTS